MAKIDLSTSACPPNSNNEPIATPEPSKERAPVASKSTKASVPNKKAGFFKREGKEVADYILKDVIKPTILDSLYDLATGTIGMLIYKDPNALRRSRGISRTRGILGSVTNLTDYSGVTRRRAREPIVGRTDYTNRRPSINSVDMLDGINIFDSYDDAYKVRRAMLDICLNEHVITVTDLYKLVGEGESADYTFDNWGWTSVDNSYISRNGDCYILELPRPRQLR